MSTSQKLRPDGNMTNGVAENEFLPMLKLHKILGAFLSRW
jgi:hypothetical protein